MHIRNTILKGYLPDETAPRYIKYYLYEPPHRYTLPDYEQLSTTLGNKPFRYLSFIITTYVGRSDWDTQSLVLVRLLDQFKSAYWAINDLRILVFVCLQWRGEESRAAETRMRDLANKISGFGDHIQFIGITLAAERKLHSLNTCFKVVKNIPLLGIGWIDDDVTLEKDCLAALAAQFLDQQRQGAVGANKIGHPNKQKAAHLLRSLKEITRPAMNYPHGCCILIEPSKVVNGIPPLFASDDGYVCFECIDLDAPDPMHLLKIVPAAICHHIVGGPAQQIVRRIRRILLNHHILLSSYPRKVSKYYFRYCLFYGLWPIAPFDRSLSLAGGMLKCSLKWLYFLFYISIGAELYFRGLFRRPLKTIPWAGLKEYAVPPTPGLPPTTI